MKHSTYAISAGVLALLLGFLPIHEGTRLPAYMDPVGIPTICTGSTKGVKMGMVATPEECQARLEYDIKDSWDIFERHVPKHVRDRMPDKTQMAFLSFIFNVGPGAKGIKDGFVRLKNGNHSTMYNKLQAGDIRGACLELPKWNRNKLRGIEIRRADELKNCLADLE